MTTPEVLEGTDRFAAARAVADAVLYEGYVLYPYRASSRKNQLRWQFGVLTPRAFSEADGSERWSMRTECLIDPGSDPTLSVRIRCLQVQHRGVEVAADGSASTGADGEFMAVERVEIDDKIYVDWEEAVDRVVDLPPIPLYRQDSDGHEEAFHLPGGSDTELIERAGGVAVGRIVRRRQPVEGRVRVTVSGPAGGGRLVKVAVTVSNLTAWAGTTGRRQEVMGASLIAVHTMLAIDDGSFVSLLDPPADAVDAVADCHNDGSFPVLIGAGDVMLSSPIILYDHPEVAPESPGDLYDSTEIDEILALRVLTLTEEEKSEARGTDPRAAAIIDRCDDMPPEMWDRLHGAVRALRPAGLAAADGLGAAGGLGATPFEVPVFQVPRDTSDEGAGAQSVPWWDPAVDASVDPWTDSLVIAGTQVSKGTAVRLQPSHRADAQDLFLKGLTATVAGVFRDVDGSAHVAVTVDDDPATAELMWQGRYLFFHPDEVEPLSDQDASR